MKTKIKNITATVLVIIMALTMITPLEANAATKKAVLNKTKVTLTITDKKTAPAATLKLKNTKKTVKWTTSNKKIVKVKSTGKCTAKVTAVKSGTATVTAKVNGKKYTCKVTVKDTRTPETTKVPACNHNWVDLCGGEQLVYINRLPDPAIDGYPYGKPTGKMDICTYCIAEYDRVTICFDSWACQRHFETAHDGTGSTNSRSMDDMIADMERLDIPGFWKLATKQCTLCGEYK